MSISLNHHGKTPFACSCGIFVNLEPHETLDWITRHSSHYAGQEHKLKQIGPPHQPDTVQGMVTSMFNAFGMQNEENKKQMLLTIQREVAKALPPVRRDEK